MNKNLSTFFNTYDGKVTALILLAFVLKCLMAPLLELGNDATYYYTYALQPDWNHFDHPPLIGIFIRIFTLDLHWVNDLSMRLVSIFSAVLCTWLIYRCGILLKNERTGWIAALLYNTSIYTSFGAGFFILPDSPQLVFWLYAIFIMLKMIIHPSPGKVQNKRLLVLGIVIGIATMCKIHSVFLWIGMGMYILLYDREYLRNPFLYASVLLTLVIISPIFFWNIQNDFVTWRYHSDRVVIRSVMLNWSLFLETLYAAFSYFGPVQILIFILVISKLRNSNFPERPLRLLLWLALPIILIPILLSFFREVFVHWTGPGHVALMIISGYVFDEQLEKGKKVYRKWVNASIIWMGIFLVLGMGITLYLPGTFGKKTHLHYGKDDISIERYGWNILKDKFEAIRQQEIDAGRMPENAPIVLGRWYPGCHYFYYIARPLDIPVIGVGSVYKVNKFAWLNRMQGVVPQGSNAYFISTSNRNEDPYAYYHSEFENIELIETIPMKRSGKLARYWYVYRLENAVRELGNILPEK